MSVRVLSFLVVSSLVACSSSSGGDTATPADSGTSPTDSGGTKDTGTIVDDDTGPVAPCSEASPPAGSQCVKFITGKIVDPSGAPVAGKPVTVCGNICYGTGATGSGGQYSVAINAHIVVSNFAVTVHGRPDFSSLFVQLPAFTTDSFTMPDIVVPKLPTDGPVIPMDDKGVIATTVDKTSGDLTLTFAAGTTADLDLEDVADTAHGNQLRAVKVETKDFPPFATAAGVTALYAINPFDSKYDKKVGIKLANTGIPDGPVEFVVLGEGFTTTPFTAGIPQVVAQGTASGGTATTNAGEGTQLVTWIGVRAKK